MHSKANVELNCKCHNIARIYTMRLLSLNLSNNQILCYKKSCIRFVVENVSRVALHRIAFWVRECGNKSKQFNTIAFSVIFHNLSIPLLQLHSFVRSFARSVGWMVLREKIGFVAIDAYVTEVVFFCICVCVCACVYEEYSNHSEIEKKNAWDWFVNLWRHSFHMPPALTPTPIAFMNEIIQRNWISPAFLKTNLYM